MRAQVEQEQQSLFRTAERYLLHYPDWCEALKDLTGASASNIADTIVHRRYRAGRPTERIALRRYMLHVLVARVEQCLARLTPREHEFVRRYYWRKDEHRMHLYQVADEMGLHRDTASQMRRLVVQTMMAVLQGDGADVSA